MNLLPTSSARPQSPLGTVIAAVESASTSLGRVIAYETSALGPREQFANEAYGIQSRLVSAIERLKVIAPGEGSYPARALLGDASNATGDAGALMLSQSWGAARGKLDAARDDAAAAVALLRRLDGAAA